MPSRGLLVASSLQQPRMQLLSLAARVQHWHNLMSTSNPRSFSEELLPAQLPTCRISWGYFISGAGLVHPKIHKFLVGPPFLLIEAQSSGQELHLLAWCQPCLYPPPHRALSHASFNQQGPRRWTRRLSEQAFGDAVWAKGKAMCWN